MAQSHLVHEAGVALAQTTSRQGVMLLPNKTPLTRLHYFDGKFLRAADLAQEQAYLRTLAALGNQGGGAGVVYGLTVMPRGAALEIEAGLAIDRDGNVLLLPEPRLVDVGELIEASRKTAKPRRENGGHDSAEFAACRIEMAGAGPDSGIPATDLYLLTICHAEELCGQEDVVGLLCEEACASISERPYSVEGLVLRADPLPLTSTAFKRSQAVAYGREHLRSLVASAYFEMERRLEDAGRLISAEGLRSVEWCAGAGHKGGCEVPLGVLARSGEGVVFVDAWTARRERMEAHPQRHWAFAMAMRPWDVFLAQVLQFQCQLHEILERGREPLAQHAHAPHRQVLAVTAAYLRDLEQETGRQPGRRSISSSDLPGGATALARLRERLHGLLEQAIEPAARMLIRGGIVELPPAGYLPVRPGLPVNEQVRAWMGDGVDLQFCSVRPDYVPHALEQAQHMERISLLEGLEDPARRPEVDVLVPNGEILAAEAGPEGKAYEGRVEIAVKGAGGALAYEGVGRTQRVGGDGRAFHFAGAGNNRGLLSGLADLLLELAANKYAVEGTLEGGRAVQPAATVVRSPGFRSRISRFADNARRLNFANYGRLSQLEVMREAVPMDRGEFLPNVGGRVDAAWLTFRTDRPFSTLTESDGDSTVSGRLLLAVGAEKKIAALDVTVNGSFNLVQAQGGLAGARQLDGALPMTLTVTSLETEGQAEAQKTAGYRLDLAARLAYDGDDENGVVTTTLALQKTPSVPLARFETSWEGFGETFRFRMLSNASGTDAPANAKLTLLARAGFSANAEVLAEDDDHHELAAKALDIVQAALLSEPGFESTARAQLFAPLSEAAAAGIVKAVEDWVLFHRRRTKVCKPLPERPAAEPPRRYRIFELTVDSAEEATAWYQRAQSSDEATQERLRKELAERKDPTVTVEFAGGSDVLTPALAAGVAADWPDFEPGRRLAYALIARPNSADRNLEQRRLDRLKAAIPSTVTIVSDVIEEQVLSSVPPGWADPTADGSMLFITVAQPVERHRVMACTLDVHGWKAFKASLNAARTEQEVQRAFAESEVELVDETDFEGASSRFVEREDDALRLAWANSARFKDSVLFASAVWVAKAEGGEASAARDRREDQATAIRRELFRDADVPLEVLVGQVDPSALPASADGKRCAAVTILDVDAPVKVKLAIIRGVTVLANAPQPVMTVSLGKGVEGSRDLLRTFAQAAEGAGATKLEMRTDAPRVVVQPRFEALVRALIAEGLPRPAEFGVESLNDLARTVRGNDADEVLYARIS